MLPLTVSISTHSSRTIDREVPICSLHLTCMSHSHSWLKVQGTSATFYCAPIIDENTCPWCGGLEGFYCIDLHHVAVLQGMM